VFCELIIYTTIKTTRVSVTAKVGALSAAGWAYVVWAWSAVSNGCGWLGVVVARKAGLNWKL